MPWRTFTSSWKAKKEADNGKLLREKEVCNRKPLLVWRCAAQVRSVHLRFSNTVHYMLLQILQETPNPQASVHHRAHVRTFTKRSRTLRLRGLHKSAHVRIQHVPDALARVRSPKQRLLWASVISRFAWPIHYHSALNFCFVGRTGVKISGDRIGTTLILIWAKAY